MRRLHSLNGLRAFEAAGRHCSFSAAARELHVTQTAVSRMVRLLEDRLGVALFRRRANGLELTTQGQALASGLTKAFDAIASLTAEVATMSHGPVLTVGVPPTLAVNWLIPRLTQFYRLHPEIEVRMATGGMTRPVRDDWTCTIRRDVGALSGYVADDLFPSALVPVCSPSLAGGLHTPADLRKMTLILVSHLPNDWPLWFEAAGLAKPIRSAAEVSFDSNAMAMQAAHDGVGVAIAQPLYITDALASGRLVAPFPIVAMKPETWALQYRSSYDGDPALIAFREWLLSEANKQRDIESKLIGPKRNMAVRKRHK